MVVLALVQLDIFNFCLSWSDLVQRYLVLVWVGPIFEEVFGPHPSVPWFNKMYLVPVRLRLNPWIPDQKQRLTFGSLISSSESSRSFKVEIFQSVL